LSRSSWCGDSARATGPLRGSTPRWRWWLGISG